MDVPIFTGYPDLKKTVLIQLKEKGGSMFLSSYLGTGEKPHNDVNFTACWPPELDNVAIESLTKKLSELEVPTSFESIYKCVRELCVIANMISENCNTVSGGIEIGLGVIFNGSLKLAYGHGESYSIARATDSDFNKIFAQVIS